MSINWYPGHMKKTKDLIAQNLKLVDVVVELLDARIPLSSRNPQFDGLIGHKKRIVLLNKYDLSDPEVTKKWVQHYEAQGIKAIPVNALTGTGLKDVLAQVRKEAAFVYEKAERQGRLVRPIRMMIVGIPNVGKSSLINKLAGRNAAKAGNKPGVTKGKQWIRLNKEIELFDTPGILWPKIEEDLTGIKLACSGAIKDEILNIEDIAYHLVNLLRPRYAEAVMARYDLEVYDEDAVVVMEAIAKRRGCIQRGNMTDYEKVSRLIIDEFRKGTIGNISLELPEEIVEVDYE